MHLTGVVSHFDMRACAWHCNCLKFRNCTGVAAILTSGPKYAIKFNNLNRRRHQNDLDPLDAANFWVDSCEQLIGQHNRAHRKTQAASSDLEIAVRNVVVYGNGGCRRMASDTINHVRPSESVAAEIAHILSAAHALLLSHIIGCSARGTRKPLRSCPAWTGDGGWWCGHFLRPPPAYHWRYA